MTRVVLPLDGFASSEIAVAHAQEFAAGGPILLITTCWYDDPVASEVYLDKLATRIGDNAETRIVSREWAPDAIRAAADEVEGSVICMATHGRTGIEELILGSVAEAVVRESEDPVLLVGPHAHYDAARATAANILVAVDTPETADRLAPAVTELAKARGLAVWVTYIAAPTPLPFVASAGNPRVAEEHEGMDRLVESLRQIGIAADTKVLHCVDPASAIAQLATQLPASYVVMGTHARSGIARTVLGSVAMRTVHHSPCPVLVVRP